MFHKSVSQFVPVMRRWRRVLFDSPDEVVFHRTDDSFARYGAVVDVDRKTVVLTKGNSQTWQSAFRFQRAQDRLLLDGEMDGYRIHRELQRVEFDTAQGRKGEEAQNVRVI